MRRIILAVVAVLLSACATAQQMPNVSLVTGRDVQYKKWYQELEQCSGLKGDFNRLTFYVTRDHLHRGRTFDGYWEQFSIVLRKPWERESVEHEMMHDLLQSADHPVKYFNGVCGDLRRGEAI